MGRTQKIIIAAIMLGVVGFLAYKVVMDRQRERLEKTVQQEQKTWQEKTERLEQKVAQLEDELAVAEGTVATKEKVVDAFGTGAVKTRKAGPESSQDIEKQIIAFFAYLDRMKYAEANKLKGGSYSQFQIGVDLLSQQLPIILGETDNLFRILKNLAHIYRVLGKERVNLTKDILGNEPELIETAMRNFFLWFKMDGAALKDLNGRPSDRVLYAYSGYFLQTIGGRAYLLRRDSKVRTLTYHYCVLLLDRANDDKLNSLGIDIRPHIKASINNVKNQIGLKDRKKYLLELDNLANKYKW
jgi:hypothetical protein